MWSAFYVCCIYSSPLIWDYIVCNIGYLRTIANMHGSRKFCHKGSDFDNIFFIGSKYHYKSAINHLNGVSLACRWWPNIECWLESFMIYRGSAPVLLRNPIFCDFSGGVWTPCPQSPPSGSVHEQMRWADNKSCDWQTKGQSVYCCKDKKAQKDYAKN